jgi:transcriptional regulator with XRE-family HTH domain
MELHEEIRRARKDLGLSQAQLAAFCGIQRRQLSTLERGGNVTLTTLRKVMGFLPNLQDFTLEQVRMKPTYIDLPSFDWAMFYMHLSDFQRTLEGVGTAVKAWLANPPGKDVDPEVVTRHTTNLATEILKVMTGKMAGFSLPEEEAKPRRKRERKTPAP